MLTISIEDKWVDMAQRFGDVERVVKEALRTYLTEQCQHRIERAAAKIEVYTQTYGCDYHSFKQSVQTDEDFLTKIEAQNPLWEEDAMEWEYWVEEKQTWHDQLEIISQR